MHVSKEKNICTHFEKKYLGECGVLALCIAAALNNFCLLTVRALAHGDVSQILEISRDTARGPDIEHGTTCDNMKIYSGADLLNGLNLVHHLDTIEDDDQIMRTLGL